MPHPKRPPLPEATSRGKHVWSDYAFTAVQNVEPDPDPVFMLDVGFVLGAFSALVVSKLVNKLWAKLSKYKAFEQRKDCQ